MFEKYISYQKWKSKRFYFHPIFKKLTRQGCPLLSFMVLAFVSTTNSQNMNTCINSTPDSSSQSHSHVRAYYGGVHWNILCHGKIGKIEENVWLASQERWLRNICQVHSEDKITYVCMYIYICKYTHVCMYVSTWIDLSWKGKR
jgi:hypothetical protein